MAEKKNLLLLLDRPHEPVFMEKRHFGGSSTVFDVPDSYLTDRYRSMGGDLTSSHANAAKTRVPVNNIEIPDLSVAMSLDRNEQFSLFIPMHRDIAANLIDVFMGMESVDELQCVAVYARDRVNPVLFNYALSVAILHRPDTKEMTLPLCVETFPDKFIDSKIFSKIREEASVVPDGFREPIIISKNYTASDLDEEHRLWYFREDVGINLHHWHWHLVYPISANDRTIVDKDRRGELFFYMHQQIIARYNFERFSNHLPRVTRLNNLRQPIPEAYFPKMDSRVASRSWAARAANTQLSDLNRDVNNLKMDVADLERWCDRFYEAIDQGFVIDDSGNRIDLDERTGIDILGNMMEASMLSPNSQLYGNLHNMLHLFISYSHDPDHRHLEGMGVMGEAATAMRDPIFYRVHAFVDDIFQEHKKLLEPYTELELGFKGITIDGVTVQPATGNAGTFYTHWQESDIDLSRGLDFLPRGDVLARFTHLQHQSFTYEVQISNSTADVKKGTVRIFMAPKYNERNLTMHFKDQRLLMTELDRFIVTLNPGKNVISQRSTDSSITIPFERTFRDLDKIDLETATDEQAAFNFCGCGWPQHMLIPKGRAEGLQCELFVMVSDYEDDRVEQELCGKCGSASSFCGIRDRLYPDRRPMGYPFDRMAQHENIYLDAFLLPNMNVTDVVIQHIDEVQPRPTKL